MEDWRAWCQWGSWAARPRAIGSFSTQSLISLAPLGPPPPPTTSLSGSFPSNPSFHHCPFCSFQPQWSLCSADGKIPSVREWEGHIVSVRCNIGLVLDLQTCVVTAAAEHFMMLLRLESWAGLLRKQSLFDLRDAWLWWPPAGIITPPIAYQWEIKPPLGNMQAFRVIVWNGNW